MFLELVCYIHNQKQNPENPPCAAAAAAAAFPGARRGNARCKALRAEEQPCSLLAVPKRVRMGVPGRERAGEESCAGENPQGVVLEAARLPGGEGARR